MTFMRTLGSLGIICAAWTTACHGPSPKDSSTPLSIVGQDTTIAIDKDTPLNPLLHAKLGAIGKMTGGCTAFHIGHGLVVTAGHCLNLNSADWTETSCHNLTVVWGETRDAQNLQRSRCTKIIRYQHDSVADVALIEVDPAPKVSLELQGQESTQNFGAEAVVLGYPKDKSLSSSGTCDAVWESQPENKFFRHRCDTLPGNSGSPIFNAATAKVIGVHDGEVNESENYGSLLPDAASILKLFSELEQTIEPADHLAFGPFADKMAKNLVNFSSKKSVTVSFDLTLNIEASYDKVLLIDGKNRSIEFSGQHFEHFEKLQTPVSIVVLTDYSGTSQAVTLSAIGYN